MFKENLVNEVRLQNKSGFEICKEEPDAIGNYKAAIAFCYGVGGVQNQELMIDKLKEGIFKDDYLESYYSFAKVYLVFNEYDPNSFETQALRQDLLAAIDKLKVNRGNVRYSLCLYLTGLYHRSLANKRYKDKSIFNKLLKKQFINANIKKANQAIQEAAQLNNINAKIELACYALTDKSLFTQFSETPQDYLLRMYNAGYKLAGKYYVNDYFERYLYQKNIPEIYDDLTLSNLNILESFADEGDASCIFLRGLAAVVSDDYKTANQYFARGDALDNTRCQLALASNYHTHFKAEFKRFNETNDMEAKGFFITNNSKKMLLMFQLFEKVNLKKKLNHRFLSNLYHFYQNEGAQFNSVDILKSIDDELLFLKITRNKL